MPNQLTFSTQHHWNASRFLWPKKHHVAKTCSYVQTRFGKVCEHEEGIILILASTKFPLTSFAWKIKKKTLAKSETSRTGGFLLHWKHPKKHVIQNSIFKTVLKKTLDCSLQYFYTPCWTAEQKPTKSKQKSKLLSSRDVLQTTARQWIVSQ